MEAMAKSKRTDEDDEIFDQSIDLGANEFTLNAFGNMGIGNQQEGIPFSNDSY